MMNSFSDSLTQLWMEKNAVSLGKQLAVFGKRLSQKGDLKNLNPMDVMETLGKMPGQRYQAMSEGLYNFLSKNPQYANISPASLGFKGKNMMEKGVGGAADWMKNNPLAAAGLAASPLLAYGAMRGGKALASRVLPGMRRNAGLASAYMNMNRGNYGQAIQQAWNAAPGATAAGAGTLGLAGYGAGNLVFGD